jgi:hypothetical protein
VNGKLIIGLEAKAHHSSQFSCEALKSNFLKYNTPVPSSAAVERVFSLGKDILQPKRSRLSDKHFEMLVFLKANGK